MSRSSLKSKVVPWLLSCCKTLAERSPEIAAHAFAALPDAGAGVSAGVLPLSILLPPLIERFNRHYENRSDALELIELYRKSLLKALEELGQCEGMSQEDRNLLDLWKRGLKVSATDDPFWAAMLDEEIP